MHGEIIGESRTSNAWIVKRDDVKVPVAYDKSVCQAEQHDGRVVVS